MQNMITEIMQHMSHANEQMARVLEAERHVAVRLSEIVLALPDEHPNFGGVSGLMENTQAVGQNIIAYLNSIADFQETIASQLTYVVRELREADAEE